MDHRRRAGRRGRSADRLGRSRRDRSAHRQERRSLGSQLGWVERRHVAIWHALSRRRSQKRRKRSKGTMRRRHAFALPPTNKLRWGELFQKPLLPRRTRARRARFGVVGSVEPHSEKYFDFLLTQITAYLSPSRPTQGAESPASTRAHRFARSRSASEGRMANREKAAFLSIRYSPFARHSPVSAPISGSCCPLLVLDPYRNQCSA
jgi:hypothetical protein